jgi:hypothetical protein
MFTSFNRFFLFTVIALLFTAGMSFSQDGHIVYVQTFEFQMPEGGSWSEFDSLTTLVTENVTAKYDKVLSQRFVRHLWGSDSRQLIIIREYSKIEDLVLDDTADGDLFRAHWKTPEERKAFSQAYNKYWRGKHSDEIYQEFKGGRK